MMSQKRSVAIKKYRGFVLSGIRENDGDPLKNLYGGSILVSYSNKESDEPPDKVKSGFEKSQ